MKMTLLNNLFHNFSLKMIKFLKSITAIKLNLELVGITEKNNDIYFIVKDFGQLKPHYLTINQISDKSILKNIHATEAFTIGSIICDHQIKRYKFKHLRIDESGHVYIYRDTDEISGDILEISNDPDLLESCSGDVLRELIKHAYRSGHNQGLEMGMQFIQNNEELTNSSIDTKNLIMVNFNEID